MFDFRLEKFHKNRFLNVVFARSLSLKNTFPVQILALNSFCEVSEAFLNLF